MNPFGASVGPESLHIDYFGFVFVFSWPLVLHIAGYDKLIYLLNDHVCAILGLSGFVCCIWSVLALHFL